VVLLVWVSFRSLRGTDLHRIVRLGLRAALVEPVHVSIPWSDITLLPQLIWVVAPIVFYVLATRLRKHMRAKPSQPDRGGQRGSRSGLLPRV